MLRRSGYAKALRDAPGNTTRAKRASVNPDATNALLEHLQAFAGCPQFALTPSRTSALRGPHQRSSTIRSSFGISLPGSGRSLPMLQAFCVVPHRGSPLAPGSQALDKTLTMARERKTYTKASTKAKAVAKRPVAKKEDRDKVKKAVPRRGSKSVTKKALAKKVARTLATKPLARKKVRKPARPATRTASRVVAKKTSKSTRELALKPTRKPEQLTVSKPAPLNEHEEATPPVEAFPHQLPRPGFDPTPDTTPHLRGHTGGDRSYQTERVAGIRRGRVNQRPKK